MRLLLLTAFSLLASCGTLISNSQQISSPASFDVRRSLSTIRSNGVEDKRALRVSKSTVNEERGIEALTKWARTTYWIKANKRPSEVKYILNLDGLSGTALKSAPNYAYLEHFVEARNMDILKVFLSKRASTGFVWKTMELENIPKHLRKNDPGFKMYVSYLNMYDNEMMKLKNKGGVVNLDFGTSAAEKAAKVDIWIKEKRPLTYVEEVLKIGKPGDKSFKESENHPYYLRYVNGIEKNQMKEWLASGAATEKIWKFYEVGKLPDVLLKRSQAYQSYVHYALKYDDEMFALYKNGKEVTISSNSIKAEMNVKVELWAKMGRPNEYVRKMLGMDGNALKESPNYAYYAEFLRFIKQKNKIEATHD